MFGESFPKLYPLICYSLIIYFTTRHPKYLPTLYVVCEKVISFFSGGLTPLSLTTMSWTMVITPVSRPWTCPVQCPPLPDNGSDPWSLKNLQIGCFLLPSVYVVQHEGNIFMLSTLRVPFPPSPSLGTLLSCLGDRPGGRVLLQYH